MFLCTPSQIVALMSRIERKCCVISTSYLAGLFDISSYYFIFDRIVWGLVTFTNEDTVMLVMKNLNLISVQSWTYVIPKWVSPRVT